MTAELVRGTLTLLVLPFSPALIVAGIRQMPDEVAKREPRPRLRRS